MAMLPRDLILVRHGESEGNVANKRSRQGDDSAYTADFLNRHSTQLRLTDKGKKQAKAAGQWLRENGFAHFDRHYVSEYARALETAALLDLPDASWYMDFQLRERSYGLMDIIPDSIRKERFAEHMRLRNIHLFYAPLPDGESMAEACDRVRNNVIATLHREMSDKRVIIVSHGETIRAIRVVLERMPADLYHSVDKEDPPWFKIGNGQVIHYTRVDPNNPENILPYPGWVRSVNPYDPPYAGHDWQKITRKKYSNVELLAMAENSARLIDE
jgi:NAD+ kinase